MKKRITIAAIIVATLAISMISMADDYYDADGNEFFNLKERWLDDKGKMPPVMFPHTFHQDKNDYECTRCHSSDAGGPFELEGEIKGTTYKNAAHNFCWTCHKSRNVTAIGHTCSQCHQSYPDYSRFKLDDEPAADNSTDNQTK